VDGNVTINEFLDTVDKNKANMKRPTKGKFAPAKTNNKKLNDFFKSKGRLKDDEDSDGALKNDDIPFMNLGDMLAAIDKPSDTPIVS
jgi:hypothetical protein